MKTVTKSQSPFSLFQEWMAEAEKSEPNDPTATALATATADGRPTVRMVLIKGLDERGIVFYTNLGSRKARELEGNPRAAICCHWKSLRRQVRADGVVETVSDEEADAYFASRPRLSQIGAWASIQSKPMKGRFEFEKRIAEFTAKFNVGEVPRPGYWSGFRLVPEQFEFWQDQKYRLHDRVVYSRSEDGWTTERLYP
ncbi:MAG: pyridoxamine 5'-phosphate oxidase [Rhodospirillales bacterium]|nr:pyridoxamine 5'-phosphate oxidase [Rhodospirillales bacterium]